MELETIMETIKRKYSIDIRSVMQGYEKESFENIIICLYILADEILKEFRRIYSKEECITDVKNITIAFSIDIKMWPLKNIPAYFDIYIYQRNGEMTKTLYCCNDMIDAEKRLYIAQGFSYYVINYSMNSQFLEQESTKHFNYVGLSKDKKDFLYTIMTSFILLPIDKVIELLLQYKEKQYLSREEKEWALYRHLSCEMGVYSFEFQTLYKNIQYLHAILYNYKGPLNLEICRKIREKK